MKAVLAIRDASGVLSLLFLGLAVFTGWGLMSGYVPSDAEAFASVLWARQAGGAGAFVRNLHHHASFGLVVTGFLYLFTLFLAGRHTESRSTWWLGASAYLLVLGICFTGFLLPMDQNAYWGSIVRLGIVETAPVAGPAVADLIRGGAALNASTLPRFYALHVSILPFIGFLLILPLLGAAWKRFPDHRRAWVTTALAGLAGVYALASLVEAPLELPADPTETNYVPRPEWYFLWLFQFGKYVESVPWVRSLVLPAAGLGLLYALPLLSSLTVKRRIALATGWCLAWLGLTGLALWEDRKLPPKLSYEEAMAERTFENYQIHCYDCHGETGRGDGPETRAWGLDTPDFTVEKTWQESSRREMLDAIKNGVGEDMPSFKKRMSPAEIEALLDDIEKNFRKNFSSGR